MEGRDVMVLAEGLKAWREVRGLSQEQLADAAEVSITLISFIENGKRQPRLGNAIRIAQALNIPLAAFAIVKVNEASAA